MGSPPRRIVVAGGGIAGLTACETLRAEGFDGELVLVSAEEHPAYSRPALSKALLAHGELDAHELPSATHGAVELRGVRTTELDADERALSLSDSTRIGFDGLVIATGSRARRLTDSPHERTLRDLGDAVALRAALAARPDVAVVGGGVLGSEIASAALDAGCRVTLVARAVPMSAQLGLHLAGIVGVAARERGLETVIAREVRVRGGQDGMRILADGSTIDADLFVTAVGDVPNLEWLNGSGLVHPGGILQADDRGRVRSGIVTAGDAATWTGPHGPWRLPLWTSAIEQAKAAAVALLRGTDAPPLTFQPYFWTEQFGLHIKAIGDLPLSGAPEVIQQDAVAALLRWTHAGGSRTAVAVNQRIPLPKLRRLAAA